MKSQGLSQWLSLSIPPCRKSGDDSVGGGCMGVVGGMDASETQFSPIVNISITGRYLIPT